MQKEGRLEQIVCPFKGFAREKEEFGLYREDILDEWIPAIHSKTIKYICHLRGKRRMTWTVGWHLKTGCHIQHEWLFINIYNKMEDN